MIFENLTESFCALFRDKIQSDLTPTDINVCHHLGNTNSLALIVKFV